MKSSKGRLVCHVKLHCGLRFKTSLVVRDVPMPHLVDSSARTPHRTRRRIPVVARPKTSAKSRIDLERRGLPRSSCSLQVVVRMGLSGFACGRILFERVYPESPTRLRIIPLRTGYRELEVSTNVHSHQSPSSRRHRNPTLNMPLVVDEGDNKYRPTFFLYCIFTSPVFLSIHPSQQWHQAR